jgi:FkbM family methyltransferase
LFKLAKHARYGASATFTYERQGCAPITLRLAGAALSLYYLGDYEPSTLGPVATLGATARGFLDIGAQSGVYAFVVASTNPNVSVVAFEANPASLEVLLDNVRLNEGRRGVGHVRICQAAVSDVTGAAEFHLAGGSSSLSAEFRSGSRPLICQTTTVDGFFADIDIDQAVDLIKIDTESTEPAVLRGMAETIARWRPVIAVEVLRGRTEGDLNRFLLDNDYRPLWLTDPAPLLVEQISGDGEYVDLNFLLVPAEKLQEVMCTVNASAS